MGWSPGREERRFQYPRYLSTYLNYLLICLNNLNSKAIILEILQVVRELYYIYSIVIRYGII